MIKLRINDSEYDIDAPAEMPLLWALRDKLDLTGTKFGCGVGICGACTVHIDGAAQRACIVPVGEVGAAAVTTIEALGAAKLHPVQQAWIDLDVPQCGHCQSGMIMQVVDLLTSIPKPTDDDIDAALTNICRCGTYPRIRAGIARAVQATRK